MSYYSAEFCLDCGFDYTWCLRCGSCACGCLCWDEELWRRSREANLQYGTYRLWRDEGAQGVSSTQSVVTVTVEGDYL